MIIEGDRARNKRKIERYVVRFNRKCPHNPAIWLVPCLRPRPGNRGIPVRGRTTGWVGGGGKTLGLYGVEVATAVARSQPVGRPYADECLFYRPRPVSKGEYRAFGVIEKPRAVLCAVSIRCTLRGKPSFRGSYRKFFFSVFLRKFCTLANSTI